MAVLSQSIKLSELAEAIGGTCRADCVFAIEGLRTLEKAGPKDLSFLTNAKYGAAARATKAGAILVGQDTDTSGISAELLVVENAHRALAAILDVLFPVDPVSSGVHPSAIIGAGCIFGEETSIGPFCVLGPGCDIGDQVNIKAHVYLGAGCRIGADSVVHPRAVLYDQVSIGERCVVHAGAVIGSDGFGYASGTGLPTKLQQVGTVTLGDEVEVGANSTIDRATLEETRIGTGTKMDNLVQVGHNAVVGEGCLLCAQVGVAGSARLGNQVVMAGQTGVDGHFDVPDGVQVAAKSAVLQAPEGGGAIGGIPAMPIRQWHRQVAELGKLSELRRRVAKLERTVLDTDR